jgi:pimeloyl-ACP methyl ester carboxylesterase
MVGSRSTIPVVLILAPLVLLAGQATLPSGPRDVPRIEWADLPGIVAKSPELKTGYLVVPERRFPKPDGRTIRLPFIIIKSRSASPRPDPVLFMSGGPGGSTLFQTRIRRRSPLLADRDLVLLEQRGTRFAEPALMCPEIERAGRSGWGTRLNGDPDPAEVAAAMAACAGSLERAGVDLAGYTTRESAADIADLRRLIGLPSWNLYGVSYSTKLMLTVLRDHPRGVRAVILDSVLPPEANWDEDGPVNIFESLDKIFACCREDESLRARFPGLRERFLRLLDEANRRPLEIAIANPLDGRPLALTLDGAGIMNCLYAGLEDSSTIPWIPLIIDAACRGECARLAPLARSYLGSAQGTAMGMRLTVWCNEEFPFENPDKMRRPAGLPRELARFVQTAVPLEALRAWPRGHPEARENEPVKSRVPVLIAAGEFDPDTPAKWARETASFLSGAHLIEFAGYTHVPLFEHPEAARIMKEFLAEPTRRPDPGSASIRPAFRLSWDTAPKEGSAERRDGRAPLP